MAKAANTDILRSKVKMAFCCHLEEVGFLYYLVRQIIAYNNCLWLSRTRTFATLLAASIFLGSGIAGLKNRKYPADFHSLVNMGFGVVQPKALVGFIPPKVLAFSIIFIMVLTDMFPSPL